MKIQILKSAAIVSLFAIGQSLMADPAFVNGSLTGPIANTLPPPGWSTIAGTPDTMDAAHNVGVTYVGYGATPSGPSPDGGTWVGFANGQGGYKEIFGQMVSGFTVGQAYQISWYQGNFGADVGYIGTNSIAVTVGGVYVGSGDTLGLSSNWYSDSVTFVASAANLQINFGLTDDVSAYLSIDGISLSAANAPDSGATIALLGVAGLALAGMRRKVRRA
ncbi:MAG TPA: VPDSG-CTERM sorting domain-containing protein [Lacunisphaera sp.]|nr:VPDSG-CTERM sorting domain-containing protein [Lacunisphaera sp.]